MSKKFLSDGSVGWYPWFDDGFVTFTASLLARTLAPSKFGYSLTYKWHECGIPWIVVSVGAYICTRLVSQSAPPDNAHRGSLISLSCRLFQVKAALFGITGPGYQSF
jgi:hypothetical protein